jgi:transposase-like protein
MFRHGKSPEDKQRYRCRQCLEGHDRTFFLDYSYAGQSPAVKEQIVKLVPPRYEFGLRISIAKDGAETLPKEVWDREVKTIGGLFHGGSTQLG